MGKKMGKNKGSSAGAGAGAGGGSGVFSTLDVDPRRVRYAHSKIKPLFSGCGRTIEQTLCEIRDGKTRAADLPMITVLFGPLDPSDGQRWFFSLNNRRLFVFKECREEGLLGPTGLVRVRARAMKAHEHERYTLDRCSVQAKFLFAPKPSKPSPPATATSMSTPTGVVEEGTPPAAAAAAVEGQRNPTVAEEGREDLGCCPGEKHKQKEIVIGPPREQEQEGGERGALDTQSVTSTLQRDGEEEDMDHGHGRQTWSPRSGRDKFRSWMASDSSSGDDGEAVKDRVCRDKSKRRGNGKGKRNGNGNGTGKGGPEREGAGAGGGEGGGASGEAQLGVLAGEGALGKVPAVLSRTQERARNGRRQRPL